MIKPLSFTAVKIPNNTPAYAEGQKTNTMVDPDNYFPIPIIKSH